MRFSSGVLPRHPLTCAHPVNPAFTLWRSMYEGILWRNCSTKCGRSGRGPTIDMSPRRTFQSCGNSSMFDNAERETGPVWAVADDPRVTPLGRFLRRSNLDELPQLWNVLRGDMSIVGPRPERPHFVEQFKHKIPQYMLRHKVKAGLTGWAQVNGWRGNTPLEKRIEYDLYYIENWSVRLDLKIMWLTLVKGFFHKHAY